MEEMAETMPYLCQADSECAESLVCQDEERVFVPLERVPTTTVQTAGGGLVTGSGLRLQLRTGAPRRHTDGAGSGCAGAGESYAIAAIFAMRAPIDAAYFTLYFTLVEPRAILI